MYLSASKYNDLLVESRCLEKNQGARYGTYLLFSVLLHLVLFFCFIALNHENKGHLLPGEKVVEVNLVSIGKKDNFAESASKMSQSENKTEILKEVSPTLHVFKEAAKQELPLEKTVEKSVVTGKEIDLSEKNGEFRSANLAETLQYPNNITDKISDNNVASISEIKPVDGEVHKQNIKKNAVEYNEGQALTGDDTFSMGRKYVDENFYYVKDLITRNLIYPAVARRMKWQGTVEVSFVVLKTGNVKNIRIISSSGHSVLDKNVVASIKQVQPFPPPPVVAEFTMPIKYILKNR